MRQEADLSARSVSKDSSLQVLQRGRAGHNEEGGVCSLARSFCGSCLSSCLRALQPPQLEAIG